MQRAQNMQRAHKEQKTWINVNECLPDDLADILCTTDSGEIFLAIFYMDDDGEFRFVSKQRTFGSTEFSTEQSNSVVAWMPLPDPYLE